MDWRGRERRRSFEDDGMFSGVQKVQHSMYR